MEKSKKRLKVFRQITGDVWEFRESRKVRVKVGADCKDFNELLRSFHSFGDFQIVQVRGFEILIMFFDIRHAKNFMLSLDGTLNVSFEDCDEVDFVSLGKDEYFEMIHFLNSCGEISDVRIQGQTFFVYFFDVRAARAAFCVVGKEKEETDRNLLELSFVSESTSPSPYLVNLSPSTSTENSFEEGHTKVSMDLNMFKIQLDRIITGEDSRTSLMIRNIPNKYTQSMLLELINKRFSNSFDYFHLPIDLKNHCNVGYAFINFKDPSMIPKFFKDFNGNKWEKFNSEKICELSYARIQGKHSLLNHLQISSIMTHKNSFKSKLFH